MSEAPGVPAGEQCPACGQADLTPYGNGSKWICPRCHFLLPCCEGGELCPVPGDSRPAVSVRARPPAR